MCLPHPMHHAVHTCPSNFKVFPKFLGIRLCDHVLEFSEIKRSEQDDQAQEAQR